MGTIADNWLREEVQPDGTSKIAPVINPDGGTWVNPFTKVGAVGPLDAVSNAGSQLAGAAGFTATDQAQIDADRARAEALFNQYMAQNASRPTFQAPQIQSASVRGVDPLRASAVTGPGPIQVSNPGAAQTIGSREVAAPGMVSAERIAAPSTIFAERISGIPQVTAVNATAQTAGPAAQAGAYDFNAAYIDRDLANRNVGRQDSSISLLEGAAAGTAPSAAAELLNLGQEKAAINALAIARSGKGSQQASNIRQALRNVAEAGFQASMGAAATRATEMATSRGQLSQALGEARGADTGLAVKQADLEQAAAAQNAQLRTGVSQSNAGLRSATDIENARLGTTVAIGNADRGQGAQVTNAGNALSAAQTNATTGLAAQTANAGNQLAAATSNASNALTAATGNVDRATGVAVGNADRALKADSASADAVNQRAQFTAGLQTGAATQDAANQINVTTGNADRALRAATTTSGNDLAAQTTNASLLQKAREDNQQAAIQGQQINNQAQQAGQQAVLDAQGAIQTSTGQKYGVTAGDRDRAQKTTGAAIEGVATALAPKSDERSKDGIRRESSEKLGEMLDHLEAVAFNYKPGEGPAGPQHGIIADDLEKSDIGKDMVFRDPRGMKRVDGNQVLMSLLGVAAEQNRRLKKLEASR